MKRIVYLLVAIVMIVTVIAGCTTQPTTTATTTKSTTGSTTSGTAGTTTAPAEEIDIWERYDEPVTIHIGRGGSTPSLTLEGDTIDNNVYTRWIKEEFNIDIVYDFYVTQEYPTKVALTITSGALPDLLFVPQWDQISTLINSDMVENLTPYIHDYSSELVKDIIDSYGGIEDAYKRITVDGEIRALRAFSPGYQYNLIWMRHDWLDKIGEPAPKTLDELVNVATKFVEANLGGDGTTVAFEIAANVIGGSYNSFGYPSPVFNYYGAYPKQWYPDASGNIIYGSLTNETKEALAVLADWYDKGLIDKEFVSKDLRASIGAGYSGINFASWSAGTYGMQDNMKNDPEAVWLPIPNIHSPSGKLNIESPNTESSWAVVRRGYEYPEIAIKLMNLNADVTTLAREPITRFESKRPVELIAVDPYPPGKWMFWPYAMETQYYDAQLRLSRELVKAVEGGSTDGWLETMVYQVEMARDYKSGKNKEVDYWGQYNRYLAKSYMVASENNVQILDSFFPFTTESMKLFWSDLQTLEITTFQKIVMGDMSVDDFDVFIQSWYSQGGQDILDEVNEQYKNK